MAMEALEAATSSSSLSSFFGIAFATWASLGMGSVEYVRESFWEWCLQTKQKVLFTH